MKYYYTEMYLSVLLLVLMLAGCDEKYRKEPRYEKKALSDFELMLDGSQTCDKSIFPSDKYFMERGMTPDLIENGFALFYLDETFHGLEVYKIFILQYPTHFIYHDIYIDAPIDEVSEVLSSVFPQGFYSIKDLDFGDKPLLRKDAEDDSKTILTCSVNLHDRR